jgi:hypothetical protein
MVPFVFAVQKYFLKKLKIVLATNYFCLFLYRFDVLMSKINFKK